MALAGAHASVYPITSSEAAAAMSAQIHRQVASRLHGGFQGSTLCSGALPGQQPLTPATKLQRWHCTLELSGAQLPTPCRAQANVFATSRAHRARIEWLSMSRGCHSAPPHG